MTQKAPRRAALIAAYEAAATVGDVVAGLRALAPDADALPIFVVDDGSTDATADVARRAGAIVLRHPRNRGKGAALATGLREARARGVELVVTLDADAQHPPDEALALLALDVDPGALVLGVRDLVRDGAPRANGFGNRVSNHWLSRFAARPLADTQCGMRRYPVEATLALGVRDQGFAFECEAVLRAARAGMPIIEVPVRVAYPESARRSSHFRVVRDPARIVARVVRTLFELGR